MNKNSIESLINSGQYKCALDETLTSILNKVKSATTEATVASIFETELYFFIKRYFGKDIIFEKEIGKTDLKHRFRGRIDAVSNDLIIEYKRESKLKEESDKIKATRQVINYLEQLNIETGSKFQAILTDGQKLRYFYYQNSRLHYTPFRNLDINDLDKVVKSLVNVDNKKFVPENIVKDFKFDSANSYTRKLARCLFNIIENKISNKTDMLFQEWEALFHLSENDKGQNLDIEKRRIALGKIFETKVDNNDRDYKALFVLQTTYAIIVKLIACKVISKLAFNNDIMYFSDLAGVDSERLREFIEHLEDGYVFATGGIRNLLEGDFFSWYCAKDQWSDEEAKCIMSIVKLLEDYTSLSLAYGHTAIDIFKDLYMEIMPNEVRHSLGEYFTPSWLADYVVKESVLITSEKEWSAIDPCCGSGIFVVALIKQIIGATDILTIDDNEKEILLKKILSRVHGIDINPLSVLTSRVSYLLAIAPLLNGNKLEIPIYLGDSANIPQEVILNGVKCYEYIITTKQGNINVTLPCKFVHSSNFLEKMSLLQTTIKAENSRLVLDKLVSNISDDELNPVVRAALKNLSEKFVALHKNNWDGIWIRIVSNFMLIARIRNIDIIIGNPPWVKWEFLPQLYAEKIKALCLDKHLFSGQTYMGAISLNICALISNVTASSWLNENGVLAFLMPKTLMTQDSYAGFRNFYLDVASGERLYLQKVDDWSKSGNPFIYTNEKFLTYYYKKNKVDYSKGVPIKYITKCRGIEVKEINWNNDFTEVEKYFTYLEGMAYQLDNERTGFTMLEDKSLKRVKLFNLIIGKSDYKARSGVEFTPAEIYFIEPIQKTNNNNTYKFKNIKFKNSIYKAELNKGFELEKKYVRPVIKSPCIKEFGIEESNNYCIFPYDENDTNSVALEKLNIEAEYLTNYFINNKNLIERQSKRSLMISKGNDFYSLSKVGQYTFAKNLVVFRDNTKLVASVIKPLKTPWDEKIMPICAKHSPYISMDKKGNYITEDEAYFLCGILNTNIVQEYFKFTYSGRSFSIAFNIKLPKYDSMKSEYKRIVELSKKAHGIYDDLITINKIKNQIEVLYLEICKTI